MKYILLGFLLVVISLSGCNYPKSSTKVEQERQEQMTSAANMVAGMPAITHFTEKKLLKTLLELRDTPNLATYSYIVDMGGHTHKLCDSIGFGLPYATQYTNPQQDTYNTSSGSVHVTLPQADPNGLYSPASAEGTWIICVDKEKKTLAPTYVEPRVIVSTIPLNL
jgi:hypothetical protein